MTAPCPLLGDGITDDTLLHIAHFLPTARDLLCLRLTCPRFAAKCIAAASGISSVGGAAAGGSAGDAVHRGRGGAAVGGGVQRAGAGMRGASQG